jgi:hypothetical protein
MEGLIFLIIKRALSFYQRLINFGFLNYNTFDIIIALILNYD